MKWATVPLSAVAKSPGLRFDAEFYVAPGDSHEKHAAQLEARARRLVELAAQEREAAAAVRAQSAALGIIIHDMKEEV